MYGLRVRNQSGFIQIDNAYSNLALRSKGSITCSAIFNTNQGPANIYQGTVTIAMSDGACIAIRSDWPCAILRTTNGSGSRTFTFLTQGGAGVVEYFVFDSPDFAGAFGAVGLRVRRRDLSGYAFDSRKPYMKVMGTAVTTPGATQSTDVGFPGGRLAWVPSQQGQLMEVHVLGVGPTADVAELYHMAFVSPVAGGIRVSMVNMYARIWRYPQTPNPPSPITLQPSVHLVLDVQGA